VLFGATIWRGEEQELLESAPIDRSGGEIPLPRGLNQLYQSTPSPEDV